MDKQERIEYYAYKLKQATKRRKMNNRERVFDMFKILIKENMTIGGQFSDLEIDAFARNAYQIVEQFDSTFSELEQEDKEMDDDCNITVWSNW